MGHILARMLEAGISYEINLGNTARAKVLAEALARVIKQYQEKE